jgi:uncharacterized protein
VISAVNGVGVELNTASKQLLSYVSGLNARSRGEHRGPAATKTAHSRAADLLKVPRLGDKAFEQAAGFLRIRDAVIRWMRARCIPNATRWWKRWRPTSAARWPISCSARICAQKIELKKYVSPEWACRRCNDIMNELAKPGRDPRKQFEVFALPKASTSRRISPSA